MAKCQGRYEMIEVGPTEKKKEGLVLECPDDTRKFTGGEKKDLYGRARKYLSDRGYNAKIEEKR